MIIRTDDPALQESVQILRADPRYYRLTTRIAEQWRAIEGVFVMNYHSAEPGRGSVGIDYWGRMMMRVWLNYSQSIYNKNRLRIIFKATEALHYLVQLILAWRCHASSSTP